MTSLVMLSGGMDSTCVLYKTLKETDLDVHAHHVVLKDPASTHRWKLEKKAISYIVPWLSNNLRKFNYTESIIDTTFLNWSPEEQGKQTVSDSYQILIMQAVICERDRKITNIREGYRPANSIYFKKNKNCSSSRATYCEGVIKYMPTAPQGSKEISFSYPVKNLTTDQVFNSLPKELRENTWSCRTPIKLGDNKFMECGLSSCYACDHRHLQMSNHERQRLGLSVTNSRIWDLNEE